LLGLGLAWLGITYGQQGQLTQPWLVAGHHRWLVASHKRKKKGGKKERKKKYKKIQKELKYY